MTKKRVKKCRRMIINATEPRRMIKIQTIKRKKLGPKIEKNEMKKMKSRLLFEV